jgi:hypothetical protein
VKVAVTLSEINDPKAGQVTKDVFDMLKANMLHHSASITKGWTPSMREGLAEALKRNDLSVHAKLDTGVELLLGKFQDHIEDIAAVFKMAYSGTAPLVIIVRVDGFEETAPPDPKAAETLFPMRHNMSQFLAP